MSDQPILVLHREGCQETEIPVRECPDCLAIVAEDRTGAHERYHATARRAS